MSNQKNDKEKDAVASAVNAIVMLLIDAQGTLDGLLGDTDPYIPTEDEEGVELTEQEIEEYIQQEEPLMYTHQRLVDAIPRVRKLISGLEAIVEAGRMNENSRVQYMVQIARNTLEGKAT